MGTKTGYDPAGFVPIANAVFTPSLLLAHPSLGVKTPQTWARQTGRFEPGETLLLHSDGLPEARDASGAEFGDARVEASIRRAAGLPAPALVDALSRDLAAFCGRESPEDDVTIAAIRRLA
jgi:sigma-B regulation protein RsbU (phosphoserine phosphatase)